jgi:hypothetical protein
MSSESTQESFFRSEVGIESNLKHLSGIFIMRVWTSGGVTGENCESMEGGAA